MTNAALVVKVAVEHGPNWCDHHQVNHHSKTQCPYKGKSAPSHEPKKEEPKHTAPAAAHQKGKIDKAQTLSLLQGGEFDALAVPLTAVLSNIAQSDEGLNTSQFVDALKVVIPGLGAGTAVGLLKGMLSNGLLQTLDDGKISCGPKVPVGDVEAPKPKPAPAPLPTGALTGKPDAIETSKALIAKGYSPSKAGDMLKALTWLGSLAGSGINPDIIKNTLIKHKAWETAHAEYAINFLQEIGFLQPMANGNVCIGPKVPGITPAPGAPEPPQSPSKVVAPTKAPDGGKEPVKGEPTGECPDGHKTYLTPIPHNCPQCGKVMNQTGAGGTKQKVPADIEKLFAAEYPVSPQVKDEWSQVLSEAFSDGPEADPTALVQVLHDKFKTIKKIGPALVDYQMDMLVHAGVLKKLPNGNVTLGDGKAIPKAPPPKPAPKPADPEKIKKIEKHFLDSGKVNAGTGTLKALGEAFAKKDYISSADFTQAYEALGPGATMNTPQAQKLLMDLELYGLLKYDSMLGGYYIGKELPALTEEPKSAPIPPGHKPILSVNVTKQVYDALKSIDPTAGIKESKIITDTMAQLLGSGVGIEANVLIEKLSDATALTKENISDVLDALVVSDNYPIDSTADGIVLTPSAGYTTIPVLAPPTAVPNVPSVADAAAKLGWNETGKGMRLLQTLNKNDAEGCSLDEAILKMPGEKVSNGVGKYLLDKAIEAGLAQRVQGSNPPKYIFSAKDSTAAKPVPATPTAKSKKMTMAEVKELGASIVSQLDMLKTLPGASEKGIGQDLAFVLSKMGDKPESKNALTDTIAEALETSQSTAAYLLSDLEKKGLLRTDAEGKVTANTQPTGACPDGHKTYQSPVPHNCPSCGKVMAPGDAAKAPGELPAQAPLPPASPSAKKPAKGQPDVPVVSSVLGTPTKVPPAEELTFTGKASLGGAHSDKQFMQDTEGRQYLFKGTGEDSYFRAKAGEVYSQLAQSLLGPDDSVPVQAMQFPDGKIGSVQPMIPGAVQLDKSGVTVETMKPEQIRDLVRNRVLDWLMSNHDTKPANWVLTPAGKVVGIDREQAFKKIGLDSLDPSFTHAPGASKQIYQALFEGYASGTVQLEPNDALSVIEAAEAIPDAAYLEQLQPFLDQSAKDNYWSPAEKAAKVKAIVERKKNLRADFEQLFTSLNQQKGIAGPFKFGQKAPSTAPKTAPGTGAVGTPSSGSSGTDLLGQEVGILGLKTPSGQAINGALGQALAASITKLFESNAEPSGANLTLAIKNVIGGSMVDAQAVIAALVKKGVLKKDPGGSGAFSIGAKYLTSGTSIPGEPTAICPDGHKTYLSPVPHNCPQCGKVMEPGAVPEGLSPVEPTASELVPKTADQFPDALKMLPMGAADGLGGVKDKSFLKDPKTGAEYMFKPDDEDWRAGASATFANIGQKLIGADRVIPVKQVKAPVKTESGTVKIESGAMQPMLPGVVSDLQKVNIAGLKPEQLSQIQDERVLDWLMSNHDSKAENFLLMQDGSIIGCDKEQAFKYIEQDELSTGYQPNKSTPIYNQMYQDYAAGKIDIDLQRAGALIDKIEAFPDEQYKALVQPYLDSLKGYGYGSNFPQIRAAREAAIMKRKKSIRADFEKFFTGLQNQRGIPGPFKFAAGGPSKAPDAPKTAPGPKTPSKPKPVPPANLPKASTLQDTGDSVSGSTAGMKVLADFAGKEYIFKPATSAYRALAPQAASMLARMVDPSFAVPVVVDASLGQLATLQPKVPSTGTFEQACYTDGVFDPSKVTSAMKHDLQKERVIDWVLSNHDSHGRNLLINKGRLFGIDKSQSFKNVLNDKLSDDFHPNAMYGEEAPVYNRFYQAYADGKINMDLNDAQTAIAAIESTPDEQWMAAVEPYLKAYVEKVGEEMVDKMRTAILARKQSVRSDFETFYTKLQNQRGVPGPFKFSA